MVRTARLQAELWKSKTVQEQNNTTAKAMGKNTKKRGKKEKGLLRRQDSETTTCLNALGITPKVRLRSLSGKLANHNLTPRSQKKDWVEGYY
jgi:hypothetical protein